MNCINWSQTYLHPDYIVPVLLDFSRSGDKTETSITSLLSVDGIFSRDDVYFQLTDQNTQKGRKEGESFFFFFGGTIENNVHIVDMDAALMAKIKCLSVVGYQDCENIKKGKTIHCPCTITICRLPGTMRLWLKKNARRFVLSR